MTLSNTKISLRVDSLQNWQTVDPTLKNGEIAIVNDEGEGIQRFKVGNGLSSFTQLPFVNQKKVITNLLDANGVEANYVAQGAEVQASPLAFAAGVYLSAIANFSQALGINAQVSAGDEYSFIWNGDDTRFLSDHYESHGKGSFSINPLSGLSGVFIGEENLVSILCSSIGDNLANYYQKSETSSSTEISNALQNYYQKSETSSAYEISSELSSKVDLDTLVEMLSQKSKVTFVEWED